MNYYSTGLPSSFVKCLTFKLLQFMFAAILPFLLSAGASIGSSIIGNIGASDRQAQMNAYNAPAAQMARYSAAGLNPNLIYGSGGSAGNQASPAAFYTPDVDPVKIWSASVAAKESRMRNELHRARTNAENVRTAFNELNNAAKTPFLNNNAQYQSQIMRMAIGKAQAQTNLLHDSDLNILKDGKIKDQILNERLYYNGLRDYGIEKGDNPLIRMGALLFKKYHGSFNQGLQKTRRDFGIPGF